MYKAFLLKAMNQHEESLALFTQTKELLDKSKYGKELVDVDKDIKTQIEELQKIIEIKNSFATKCKDGIGYAKTPQGMATTLVVVGAISFLGY